MGPLQLVDLPVAIPMPCRGAEAPDGLDLNTLLIPNPLSTFFPRVRGHHLRAFTVGRAHPLAELSPRFGVARRLRQSWWGPLVVRSRWGGQLC